MKNLLSKIWTTWNPIALAVIMLTVLFVAVVAMLVVLQAILNTVAGPYIFLSAVALFFIWVIQYMIIDDRKMAEEIKRLTDNIDKL
jgi:hypothetical protein